MLIQVGSVIGTWPTVGLVILTAVLGGILLRQQGEMTLSRAQMKMREGSMPAGEMVEGLFLAVGGALLLTPGFITDSIGLACLIPGIRKHILLWGMRHLGDSGTLRFSSYSATGAGPFSHQASSGQPNSRRPNSRRPHSQRPTSGRASAERPGPNPAGDVIEGEYKRED